MTLFANEYFPQVPPSISFKKVFFFFPHLQYMEVSGPGIEYEAQLEQGPSYGNARSLIYCAWPGIQRMPQH